jgi:hypothetical protein
VHSESKAVRIPTGLGSCHHKNAIFLIKHEAERRKWQFKPRQSAHFSVCNAKFASSIDIALGAVRSETPYVRRVFASQSTQRASVCLCLCKSAGKQQQQRVRAKRGREHHSDCINKRHLLRFAPGARLLMTVAVRHGGGGCWGASLSRSLIRIHMHNIIRESRLTLSESVIYAALAPRAGAKFYVSAAGALVTRQLRMYKLISIRRFHH